MSFHFFIVDDDPVVQQILGTVLSANGYTFSTASDDSECLNLLNERKNNNDLPKAIFLDLMLGFVSGIEVLEKIHEMLGKQHVPVIMLSANTKEEMVADLNPAILPDFYLQKPFNNAGVKEIINQL